MWNGVFPAISVNKDVTIISDFGPPCELLSPSGTQKGEKWLQAMNSQLLAAIVSEELRVWIIKNQVLAPHSWDAYKRNDFSERGLLHLPILMFRLPAFCCKFLCNLTPFPISSEKFTQGFLRCCLLAWCPKNSHQIKHNFQLLGCDDFLS